MKQDKVGNFIKEIRNKHNLTQKELASKLGVTSQAVSKWENGKNIPDIAVLKLISEKFNVDIDEILSGEKNNKRKSKHYIFFATIICMFLILFTILGVIIYQNGEFEFKMISTSCKDFNITGSVAYNNDKTSLYISDVSYCGDKDETVYESIECSLYEEYQNIKLKVSSCNNAQNNITLDDFLKDVKINVDNYKMVCKEFETAKMHLEIEATIKDNKKTTFVVPISMTDNC